MSKSSGTSKNAGCLIVTATCSVTSSASKETIMVGERPVRTTRPDD